MILAPGDQPSGDANGWPPKGLKPMTKDHLRPISKALAVLAVSAAMACAPAGTGDTPAGEAGAQLVIPAPTLDELSAATFEGIYDHPVTLAHGQWEGEPFVEGGASRPTVGLVGNFRLAGDLDDDGREEAVVLLWESSGGSGTRLYLAAMAHRDEGIEDLGTVLIGDRVQVRAARLDGQRIVFDLVQAGPDDSMCCPSQKASKSWELGAEGLDLVATEVTGTFSLADLEGPEWVLTELGWEQPAPQGAEVTLRFEEGKVVGHGGCNRYFGGVTAGEIPGSLSFSAMGATRMACPDPAMELEQRYLSALAAASNHSFLAGRLVLTCQTGEGLVALIFSPREPAPASGAETTGS